MIPRVPYGAWILLYHKAKANQSPKKQHSSPFTASEIEFCQSFSVSRLSVIFRLLGQSLSWTCYSDVAE
ncbi:hypothetical protein ACSBR2_020915 [Camellia fascicularis]